MEKEFSVHRTGKGVRTATHTSVSVSASCTRPPRSCSASCSAPADLPVGNVPAASDEGCESSLNGHLTHLLPILRGSLEVLKKLLPQPVALQLVNEVPECLIDSRKELRRKADRQASSVRTRSDTTRCNRLRQARAPRRHRQGRPPPGLWLTLAGSSGPGYNAPRA